MKDIIYWLSVARIEFPDMGVYFNDNGEYASIYDNEDTLAFFGTIAECKQFLMSQCMPTMFGVGLSDIFISDPKTGEPIAINLILEND